MMKLCAKETLSHILTREEAKNIKELMDDEVMCKETSSHILTREEAKKIKYLLNEDVPFRIH